ncbi:guanylate kinase [Candidatus Propionivibrio aalborgensis]|jgi:guanylate kinase|uniref:Guanylate kinase n=1 Tax=Candidatus Propionivibrio aalborgensis TaxID=1860101 RepID=A0A1A8XFP7_9RHOO|nr:guanylate kinase [Candidatus Propionivibrio aalborgensis]MBK7326079.1 guanylate kinase [Propionivibrio sp.]MBK7564502.1 guanylate kinase [Propionivibrio sp.]MBK9026983.1 guanylate kinase [Propionivibrio sp.]SBT04004.1 guanylate kinase [Candidatus Propionivibrio aalborgensis]HRC60695.1 guanylate kinase [Candidatus Propionivibrio aalborgensis]
MPGQLFIVAAPSGAGKTTLVSLLIGNDPGIHVSISTTTRTPRPGEENGREYHFVDVQNFREMVHRNEFVEWAEVHGNYYGTSLQWIKMEMDAGRDVLLEIDWQGAQQVRKSFPEAVSVFVMPPSLEALGERLSGRGTDSVETILRRIGAARDEMRHADEFDYVIINDELSRALDDLQSIVNASRLKYTIQCQRHAALFAALL